MGILVKKKRNPWGISRAHPDDRHRPGTVTRIKHITVPQDRVERGMAPAAKRHRRTNKRPRRAVRLGLADES